MKKSGNDFKKHCFTACHDPASYLESEMDIVTSSLGPVLTPFDFHLFDTLKKNLNEIRSGSTKAVKQ